ncbi:iron ABC transporter permease [Salinirubellus salinus]|uniref:Cobalamin import system permease protein BtuC n=1 Tax=Salinirubellus salinus TaxID=1364945 RepID=A0A9E7R009_9EURY|nr:iron ABC transporter permease [Salinirubellus salinus]UWM53047.1 iron ABC transporter permease [Salinirubellus salinus]
MSDADTPGTTAGGSLAESGDTEGATARNPVTAYEERVHRKLLVVGGLLAVLLSLSAYALLTGPIEVPLRSLPGILLGGQGGTPARVVWNIRLPRIAAAVGAGFGLAVAGTVLQSLLRNPLASPYTLGISQAAAFGAAVAIVVFGAGSSTTSSALDWVPYLVTATAFAAAMCSTAAILLVARFRPATPETLVLTGIALGAFFAAGTSALEYFATNVQLAALVAWKFGTVSGATWDANLVLWVTAAVAGLYFVRRAWAYEVLDAGDDTARSLGVDVTRVRITGMIVASFLTSVVVSLFGVIGFVGLVVPHIVRRIVGGDERFLVVAASVAGGALLVASDLVARTVIAPVVLPVGIVTAFVGVPLFLYLIVNGREYW